MKKLMIAAAIVCAAVASQAATTLWSAAASAVLASDNTANYSGTMVMQYLDGETWKNLDSVTVTAANGNIRATNAANQFSTELFEAGDTVSFRFTATDGDKVYTSSTYTTKAQKSDRASILFGSQAGNTWKTSAVPEPTSGLLLLLGVAGLALRRRRA